MSFLLILLELWLISRFLKSLLSCAVLSDFNYDKEINSCDTNYFIFILKRTYPLKEIIHYGTAYFEGQCIAWRSLGQ